MLNMCCGCHKMLLIEEGAALIFDIVIFNAEI